MALKGKTITIFAGANALAINGTFKKASRN